MCADGIYPHETECNAFYQCSHGHRWEDQYCPGDLLFNPTLLVCDWPENVNCGASNNDDDENNDGSNGSGKLAHI